MAPTSQRELQARAAALLDVPIHAAPREVEAAYLEQLARLKSAYLRLGGFDHLAVAEHHTFDDFVSGPSNECALRACKHVAAHPGQAYNPLYLYGNPGLGKTHLLGAVAREVGERFPDRHVVLIAADSFTNELVSAIADQSTRLFTEKYRRLDFFLVDAVHLWSNRTRTQEEMVSVVDHLVATGRQVVFTACCAPKNLGGIMESLSSRFRSGLAVEVQYPELETRHAIVQRAAHRMNLPLPRETSFALAQRIPRDVRELEGALRRLQAKGAAECAGASLENLLYDFPAVTLGKDISLDEVFEMVLSHFRLEPHDLRSGSTPTIKRARRVGMYVARTLTDGSLQEIGRKFDASSNQVLYAERTVKRDLDDPMLSRDVEALRKRLARRPAPSPASPSKSRARK